MQAPSQLPLGIFCISLCSNRPSNFTLLAFNIADRNQLLASEESLLGGMQITSDHHLDSVIELLLENYDIKCKQRNCSGRHTVHDLHIYSRAHSDTLSSSHSICNKQGSKENYRKRCWGCTKRDWGLLKYTCFAGKFSLGLVQYWGVLLT